jgi:hypothetical protein
LDYSNAEVYDSNHKNPFERSLKIIKHHPELPQLKSMNGLNTERESSKISSPGMPRNKAKYFINKKEALQSEKFKLPEVSSQTISNPVKGLHSRYGRSTQRPYKTGGNI